ncbi:hypothetical protein D3C72_1298840 [compost metagenome]
MCLAIAKAAATVSRMASLPLAEVLAEPLRWPTYKVMPKPWSRLNSTVSTSRWRTEVDSPCSSDTATSQALAPWRLASAIICSTCSCNAGRACGPTLWTALMVFSTQILRSARVNLRPDRTSGPRLVIMAAILSGLPPWLILTTPPLTAKKAKPKSSARCRRWSIWASALPRSSPIPWPNCR